ncbi:TIGR03915 family putative DNA repair protein [Lachnospiraceae bacterium ZAX-1]
MYIFICENSIDGIFTGVYDAWASKYGHKNITLSTEGAKDNLNLFYEYIAIATDYEKSQKVANTLLQRFGDATYSELCHATSSIETGTLAKSQIDKADAIYKTIVLGLSLSDGSKVLHYLGDPYVNRVFQLSRNAGNEAHHLLGFLRFSELETGILFAKIHPKNNVLPFLADHFTDRLPQENFIIYDENRKIAAIHKQGKGYLIADVPAASQEFMSRYSEKELQYRKLWKGFFDSIAIESRRNTNLQQQNIAKHFRQDTVEFT